MERYQEVKTIQRVPIVEVIPIVIGALEIVSKNAKVWYGKLSLPDFFWKCTVASHPWDCSYPAESGVPLRSGKLPRNG